MTARDGTNVHVFLTLHAAQAAGAVRRGTRWWLGDHLVITPHMGFRPIDGLRVRDIVIDGRAAEHPEFEKLHQTLRRAQAKTRGAMGPAERYVRDYTLARQSRPEGWSDMEQALVMTLIEWKVESELRPTFGEGSDCSDLMDAALARILGLAAGDLTPEQVLDALAEQS